jgi:uncharacterized membrane protein YphA (DoxX/SURF4 family)
MFPAGAAGAALLILRLCVAGNVLLATRSLEGFVRPAASPLLTAAIAFALCPGVFTPLACALALLIQLGVLARSSGFGSVEIIIHGCMALSLLMLGPGAYSVDARLFGRRLVLPNSDEL